MKKHNRPTAIAAGAPAMTAEPSNGHPNYQQSPELVAILESLQTLRDGDFSARLPGSWVGLPGKIADTFNDIAAANQQMGQELTSGKLEFTTCKVSDIEAQVFGDTAVVRGIDEVAGEQNGETFAAKERFTDVFIRRDGRWLCVATHDSPMEQP